MAEEGDKIHMDINADQKNNKDQNWLGLKTYSRKTKTRDKLKIETEIGQIWTSFKKELNHMKRAWGQGQEHNLFS